MPSKAPEANDVNNEEDAAGYLSRGYAESLAEFGTPARLASCDGWVLQRTIPDTQLVDATGCYPLFCCRRWENLPRDLDANRGRWTTLTLVADPLFAPPQEQLQRWFDRVVAFKTHHVVDTRLEFLPSSHHRYYARTALRRCAVDMEVRPLALLEPWCKLYAELISRHGIGGIRAFSEHAFRRQLAIPGTLAFVARVGGTIIGIHLWYLQQNAAYSHLAATSTQGYELMASYALHATALEFLRSRVRWICLGAGAGLSSDGSDGLTRFKRGWSNASAPAFLCGGILDADAYARLSARMPKIGEAYFPAYRAGEYS